MPSFRARFDGELLGKVNQILFREHQEEHKKTPKNEKETEKGEIRNKGKLIIDTNCCPADIRFPNDMSILNEAREKSEKILDKLYENIGKSHIEKPRDFRRNVRRKAIRKQLQYLKMNLGIIRDLIGWVVSDLVSITLLFQLDILDEVYQQQFYLYENRVNCVDHRIVSISQPHLRPIVRGKAGSQTEFGTKISMSLMDGYCNAGRELSKAV